MYGGLEMGGLNWQWAGRAHNQNERQPITKMMQFREEYDNSAVDKFAVLMLEPSSHQRHWRISGEISSLPFYAQSCNFWRLDYGSGTLALVVNLNLHLI